MTIQSNKIILAILGGVLLLGLGAFALYKNQREDSSPVGGVYSFTTASNKKIKVSLQETATSSSALIITEGFKINVPISVDKQKLSNVFFTDLNGDSFEELVLVFAPASPEQNGDIAAFTTYYDSELTSIELPTITEADKLPGNLFEGYVGGDTFVVQENTLFRSFLVIDESSATPEDQTVQEDKPEDIGEEATSLEPDTTDEKTIPTKQKQISYVLTFSEGLFYLEPHEVDEANTFTASSTASLENTSWKWLSLNYEGNVTTALEEHPVVFSFGSEQTFSASSSCENFVGNYILTGYQLRLGTITTESSGDNSSCKTINTSLKEALPLSESFIIRGNQLMISLTENKGVVLFNRQ